MRYIPIGTVSQEAKLPFVLSTFCRVLPGNPGPVPWLSGLVVDFLGVGLFMTSKLYAPTTKL